LTQYYTNPSINISNEESQRDFWIDWYAGDVIYARGMVYLLRTDYILAKAAKDMRSKTTRPLDDILAELAVRRLNGEKIQARDWLESLYPYLGKERADKDFADMTSGKTIDLSDTEVLGDVGKLVKIQQEVLEFGFDRKSLDIRVVTDLKEGSRAELAGLREGDEIVWNSRVSVCKEDFESNMRLVVERGNGKFRIEYWPRSFEMVPVWQVISKS
jgi:predicted metalloprotease with PDZ domain